MERAPVLIALDEVQAGEAEDGALWVFLGWCSEVSPHDVLYVVSGREGDYDRAVANVLYFERFDQGWSGHDLAESIRASPEAVDVRFTEEGAQALNLPAHVRFAAGPVDLSPILTMLSRMKRATHASCLEVLT